MHSSLGRDVRPAQLGDMHAALGSWLGTCGGLLSSIEERMRWAQAAAEESAKRSAEAATRLEDARAAVKADLDLRAGADPGAEGSGAAVSGALRDASMRTFMFASVLFASACPHAPDCSPSLLPHSHLFPAGSMYDAVGSASMDFHLDSLGGGFEDRAGGRPKRCGYQTGLGQRAPVRPCSP